MSVPFFDIKRQNSAIRAELLSAIEKTVDSGAFILGPSVTELEIFAAKYIGVKHAIGVASGTDALHLSLRAAGINSGDEVITSPFTFVATAEAISYIGATPVFCDIEPNTFNLDSNKTLQKITKKTRAILPVHLYGLPSNMGPLLRIAKEHGLKVIEDCAQSIGAEYAGKKVGSLGDAGAFSFFPTKNLGCFGDGGLVTTNNDSLAELARVYRGHGSRVAYHYDLIGYNSRLDSIQAAILMVRFKYLAQWSQIRASNAALYSSLLSGVKGIILPSRPTNSLHVFNQYTIRAKDRDRLLAHLKARNIGAMIYYPLSLHLQKAFSFLGSRRGDFPESERAQGEVLSLPIFPELTRSEIEEVCSAISDFYE
ncbi:DegT/DnrJ/EryC1/StrS family aminotransferase [Candidatus Saganbacteria bacterium]|nr:DegT/DnrJ/EryC1/StrS family aminotransferase [Candidatus Saganbacteria bacterium]